PAVEVNGNDLFAVREATAEALGRARAGDGPTFLECFTYRHKGHSRVDPGRYRPKEEVEEWLGRDPLPRLAERLPADVVERVAAEVEREGEAALAAAEAAPFPEPAALGSAT